MNTPERTHASKRTPINQETMQFIRFVWTCLDETQHAPQTRIKEIVCILGTDKVKKLMQETLQIEQQGGMLTLDQSKRRTPGGVFFFLCKRHYKHQLVSVFPRKEQKGVPDERKSA